MAQMNSRRPARVVLASDVDGILGPYRAALMGVRIIWIGLLAMQY
jgi:hypothetical protein